MNKDRFKIELDNVKPEDRLVRETINLIKEKEYSKGKRNTFLFPKVALGVCSFIIVATIGYGYYNLNIKENNSSKTDRINASSTIYNFEEINSNVNSNIKELEKKTDSKKLSSSIGLNEVNESNFTGMYLVRKTDNSNWKLYKHTKDYKDYKKIINIVDSLILEGSSIESKKNYKNSYLTIYDSNGKAKLKDDTMLVKVGVNYLIYIPSDINNPIVVQLLGTDNISLYSFNLDKTKIKELNKLRSFISTTGTEIEEEKQESIDRNVKVIINGKEDKTKYAENMLYEDDNDYVNIKYTYDENLTIMLKNNFKDIENPKVTFNKAFSVKSLKNNVKKIETAYLGSDSYPYIVILTKDSKVYYIKTSSWVISGKLELIEVIKNASDIVQKENSEGYTRMYALINNENIELNIK